MSDIQNYIAYRLSNGLERIGSYSAEDDSIQPLAFTSGTPISNLYEVIEVGENGITTCGERIALSSVQLLAPISGRDVLAVGKNYAEHAVEFNSSGYDSSDKTDQPTHPVIFTKRATSIIAHKDEIFYHPDFTQTLDYEGEIGVIVGKTGFQISEADAMQHVWGYTIINDVTARERQRDHKQFYIGKSPDTFCPMGPIAVPADRLEKHLTVQTFVNGEKRQEASTETLIFSIPFLIKTLSEGITITPGDVIATGTPAGVGFGQKPPVWLVPGDIVEVKVTGLGTLSNKIAPANADNPIVAREAARSHISWANDDKSKPASLTLINSKPLFYKHRGDKSKPPIFFVHGLGGTSDFFAPLVSTLGLADTHSLHFFDLEGHGLSPTKASSILSIHSFAEDLFGIFQHADVGANAGSTVVAHSMGCIVALDFALSHPELVKTLIPFGPPPIPLPEAASKGAFSRATLAREQGMVAVADAVIDAGTSQKSKTQNPLAIAATRLSLLGQDPEGYAKACAALGGATVDLPIKNISVAECLIVTGNEDKVSPPALCKKYEQAIKHCVVKVLDDVGHWHVFEDVAGVSEAVKGMLL